MNKKSSMKKTPAQTPLTKEDFVEAMTELRVTLDQRFEAIDRKFEAIDRRFEAIDLRFEKIEKTLQKHDGFFSDIADSFTMLADRIEEVNTNLTAKIENVRLELGNQIKDVDRRLTDLAMDTPTRKEFRSLEKRVSVLENRALITHKKAD